MDKVILLVLGLMIAACSADLRPIPPAHAEPEQSPMAPFERENYLNSFPLTNLSGIEAAPRISEDGIAPFGVLLKLPQDAQVSACSVTHLSPGWLVTNAHCVNGFRSLGAQNFFVVYYNKENQRVHIPLESIGFLGDLGLNDVAILKISEAHAKTWDSLSATAGNMRSLNTMGDVTLWGFDPITLPDGGSAMAFSPKHCLASREKPDVQGIKPDETKTSVLTQVRLEPDHHIFVDHCSAPLVPGNSGSLITVAKAPTQILGVHQWAITPTEDAKFLTAFEYVGNQRIVEFLPNPPPQGFFFGVGSVLRWKTSGTEIK